MSIKWSGMVWHNSQQTGSGLLVLLAIADHANDDGICWPSVARLARMARVSERQCQRLILRSLYFLCYRVENGFLLKFKVLPL